MMFKSRPIQRGRRHSKGVSYLWLNVWQVIGMSNMSNDGSSTRSICNHFNVIHTVIDRLLVNKGTVNDRLRSGRPRLTTRRA